MWCSTRLPVVPTLNESGFKDFAFENWYGLFVPAKTPVSHFERLSQELQKVLKSPDVTAKLADLGSRDVVGTSDQATRFSAKEVPQREAVVKRSGATVD